MKVIKYNWFEIIVGTVVVTIAVLFIKYSLDVTGQQARTKSNVEFQILFKNANGIHPGTTIKVSGVKVGQVMSVHLNKKNYTVEVRAQVDADVPLSIDSHAVLSREGIIGDSYIKILPGVEEDYIVSESVIYAVNKKNSLIEDIMQKLVN